MQSISIVWLSRHPPGKRQLAELERLFPGHTITIDTKSFDTADDIVARFKREGYDETVIVAPLTVIRHLCKRGIHPLYAEMKEVDSKADYDSAVPCGKTTRYYRFVRFHRLTGVELKLEPINPPTAPSSGRPQEHHHE